MLGRSSIYANIACLKDTVFNIVVKGKAIKILLPGLKDKSLFVEASEDVFEFIREQSSRVVPEPKSEKTQNTEIDEDGLASAVKERNQHEKGTMGVLMVNGQRKLRARKFLSDGTYKARNFVDEYQSIDLAMKFLNSAEDDNEYIIEQADTDMELADEVDDVDIDDSNVDGVDEQGPVPMLPVSLMSSSSSSCNVEP